MLGITHGEAVCLFYTFLKYTYEKIDTIIHKIKRKFYHKKNKIHYFNYNGRENILYLNSKTHIA